MFTSHRSAWVADAAHWQQKTRALEDALGDALHQRLVERFVLRSAQTARRRRAPGTTPTGSNPFAQLSSLLEAGLTDDDFVQRVCEAPTEGLQVDALGRISFEGEVLARLVRGADRLTPGVALVDAWWTSTASPCASLPASPWCR